MGYETQQQQLLLLLRVGVCWAGGWVPSPHTGRGLHLQARKGG